MKRVMGRVVVALMMVAGLLSAGGGHQVSAQEPSDLTALVTAQNVGVVGAGIDSVSATTTLTGFRSWNFLLENRSEGPVTPTVSVDSGYDPSLFCIQNAGSTCDPLSSFPSTSIGPSLPAGQDWSPTLSSSVGTTFTPGFDSARAMNPLVIPVGGAKQTLTITLRASDPNINYFSVFLGSPLPGVSVVTVNGPTNLDQGESFSWGPYSDGLGNGHLWDIQTGKTYVFSVVLDVPNPFGAAFTYRPSLDVYGGWGTADCLGCLGTSVTVSDPTLDGSTLGRGGATFSVAETGHSWDTGRGTQYAVWYGGEASPPKCTATGLWRDGINLTASVINPAAPVTGTVDATTCNIGVYYGPGKSGTVSGAEIFGANYYGVVVNAAAVDVTNTAIHDIGETPLNGSQHGVGVLYTTINQAGASTGTSATGTLSGSTITNYQKNGVVISGPGAVVRVQNNTVTGQGRIDWIAQNGIQVSYGASALVTGNTMKNNYYTPKSYVACGLLFYQAGGVRANSNAYSGNEQNQCNVGKGGGQFSP